MALLSKLAKAAVVGATSLSLSVAQVSPAYAQSVASQMDAMFGTLTSVDFPGTVDNVRRGGLYGGRLRVRARTMNASFVTITPPSFRAGCGGIDFFGGSFSFISVEQFTQLLRNIASAALGYAFVIALKQVCATCVTAIMYLQRAIQMLNEVNANSCQLAQGLVNDTLTAMNFANIRGKSQASLREGVSDAFRAFWDLGEDITTQVSAETMTQRLQGNLGWMALQESSARDWFTFGGSGNELLHAILTVTGTVIISDLTPDGNFIVIGGAPEPAGRSNRIFVVEGSTTLNVSDIMDGNEAATIMRCFNETETGGGVGRCDEGVAEQTVRIVGFAERLDRMMEGDPAGDGTDGALWRMVNDPPALTREQRRFLETTEGWSELGGKLFRLARMSSRNSTAVWNLWTDARQFIAIEFTKGFFREYFDMMDAALSADWVSESPYHKKLREMVDRARGKINVDLMQRLSQIPDPQRIRESYFQLLDYLAAGSRLRLD